MCKRNDGYAVKTPSTAQLMIDIKPKRHLNEVYIDEQMDVSELVDYLAKEKENGNHYTVFHAFLTAMAKVLYNRERMNYFVSNRHLYCHNEITIGFVAKAAFDDKSFEVMISLPIEPNDTMETLSRKIKDKLDRLRNHKSEKKEGTNNAVDLVAKLPNLLRIPVMGFLKFLDNYGWMPKSLLKDNIYFCSTIISNLGSIGCGAVYHDLSEFGTCSSLATMGKIKEEIVVENGEQKIRKFCNFGITLDERIGDGFYFARCCQMIQHVLKHPEMLMEEASKKIELDK